jgi:aryl-alcohol dehydrogenase-like predicted oxidoreductase
MIPRIELGRTGIMVSALGLGCAGMSHAYGQADETEAHEAMLQAMALGMGLFDTSDSYGHGHNEELIGRFLGTLTGPRPIIATKVGDVRGLPGRDEPLDNTPAHIAQACDASLRRLGVDEIDLYYLHRRDPQVPLEDSIGAMSHLVEAGKVRWLGLSEVSPATLREADAIHPITALQSEYSLWTRDPEDGVLDACRDLRITFVPFGPLGRAFLTGTIAPGTLPADDFRANLPRFQGDAAVRNAELVGKLAEFAAGRNATPAQIALAWLLSKNDGRTTILPIPGTKRPKYLAENAKAASIHLTPDEVTELNRLFARDAVDGDRYSGVAAQMVGH